VRRQGFVRAAAYAQINLSGLTLGRHDQTSDTTLVVEHHKPHSTSRELFKHILTDHASGTFQGKVIVRPEAQKTDGGMKSHALLLSDTSMMNNKPELEIYADDVVCGHGATIAQINDDQLFYLMSRGLPKAQAQAMLIEAFAQDMLEQMSDDGLRHHYHAAIQHWMQEALA
jgi:Fe-S cluster assembly protein SufD